MVGIRTSSIKIQVFMIILGIGSCSLKFLTTRTDYRSMKGCQDRNNDHNICHNIRSRTMREWMENRENLEQKNDSIIICAPEKNSSAFFLSSPTGTCTCTIVGVCLTSQISYIAYRLFPANLAI